jgi:hypothetical protein
MQQYIRNYFNVLTTHEYFLGRLSIMFSINDIPILKEDNYHEWYRKLDLYFIMGELDWVLTTLTPTEPVIPMREDTDTDASWKQTELSYKKAKADYERLYAKWFPANKKCLAVVKNTIEPAIMDLIPDCATVIEYIEKLKNKYWFFKGLCNPVDQITGFRKIQWRWHQRTYSSYGQTEQ